MQNCSPQTFVDYDEPDPGQRVYARKSVGGSTFPDATNWTSDRSGSYELSTITATPLEYDENGTTTVSSTLARPQGQIGSGSTSAVAV